MGTGALWCREPSRLAMELLLGLSQVPTVWPGQAVDLSECHFLTCQIVKSDHDVCKTGRSVHGGWLTITMMVLSNKGGEEWGGMGISCP